MIKANIHDIKPHFSEYLARLEAGEMVLICKRNIPIAEITVVPHRRNQARPIGLAKGTFIVPETFFEHLPDDILDTFNNPKS